MILTAIEVRPYVAGDTIVSFVAIDGNGVRWVVAADHRPALSIIDAIENNGEAKIDVPDYMVLGRAE